MREWDRKKIINYARIICNKFLFAQKPFGLLCTFRKLEFVEGENYRDIMRKVAEHLESDPDYCVVCFDYYFEKSPTIVMRDNDIQSVVNEYKRILKIASKCTYRI